MSPARSDNAHRVLVTGMGAITPSGLSVPDLWDAVQAGRSAITRLDDEEFEALGVRIGGQIQDFNAQKYLRPPLLRRLEPMHVWAMAAADQALDQALAQETDQILGQADESLVRDTQEHWSLPWDPERVIVLVATGSGPVRPQQRGALGYAERGQRGVPLTLSMHGAPDAPAALISQRYGTQGPARAVSATCASGAIGMGEALRTLRHGYADAAIIIGVEDCLNPINLASNANMRALATGYEADPVAASRPFDADRNGFVMSQGAAALVVETQASADARGAKPLAELAGFGASSDAYHPTAPHPEGRGAAAAMQAALHDAGFTPETFAALTGQDSPTHINAHGTSTPAGDSAEAQALHTVFGDSAGSIPVTATKSSTGHLLGAGGVVEAVVSISALNSGIIPPTRNLDSPAFPELDVVHQPRASTPQPQRRHAVLSNSFGFGGHNGSVLFTTPQE